MRSSFALLFLLAGTVVSEVVEFSACPSTSDEDPPPPSNCTVHEVRITPCAEAAENKPCKIKKGKSASIEFDFTPSAGLTTAFSQAFWASTAGDLPFAGMNTDACSFTSCPIQENQRHTYSYNLNVNKRFPARTYDVKWRFYKEDEQVLECCFLTKIKLVK